MSKIRYIVEKTSNVIDKVYCYRDKDGVLYHRRSMVVFNTILSVANMLDFMYTGNILALIFGSILFVLVMIMAFGFDRKHQESI